MRCIEMDERRRICHQKKRLTLTWDVLKFDYVAENGKVYTININMRCIEISGEYATISDYLTD